LKYLVKGAQSDNRINDSAENARAAENSFNQIKSKKANQAPIETANYKQDGRKHGFSLHFSSGRLEFMPEAGAFVSVIHILIPDLSSTATGPWVIPAILIVLKNPTAAHLII
jgi:hypothetical protein